MIAIWWLTYLARVGFAPTGIIDPARPHTPLIFHPNDRASQEEEFALKLRTRDKERKLIKKIDESLSDLDEDEYGYCEV